MTTPGKIVLNSTGKRGLLANGKVAIFNADGECPECCVEECGYCSDGTTPKTLALTFTGVLPNAGCCFGTFMGAYTLNAHYKWLEAPTGFEEAVLQQNEGALCQYDAVLPATAGEVAYYGTAEDCANDENRVGTLTASYFYYNGQFGGGADFLLEVWCVFVDKDEVELRSSIFYIVKDLPNDESTKILCMTEWDGDNGFADECDALMYEGSINVIPSR